MEKKILAKDQPKSPFQKVKKKSFTIQFGQEEPKSVNSKRYGPIGTISFLQFTNSISSKSTLWALRTLAEILLEPRSLTDSPL